MSFFESEKASIHEMQEFLLDMQGEVLGSAEVPIGHQGICCHVVKCRQKIYRVLLDMIYGQQLPPDDGATNLPGGVVDVIVQLQRHSELEACRWIEVGCCASLLR